MPGIHRAILLIAVFVASNGRAETFPLPEDGSDVVGAVSTVIAGYDDTLVDLARLNDIGYQDIVRANPDVYVWVPGDGTEVVMPTRYVLPPGPREGIVLNLAEYRLYYFPEPAANEAAVVMTFPISIGRRDWETPLGRTRIVAKAVNPTWYPPQSVRDEHAADGRSLGRVVPPGPDNPLGKHALRLALPGYLIHGTNRPAGVGMRVTHGCLRMFPEDIDYLFDFIAVNTPVRIINEPVKIGWQGEELMIEVHPLLASAPIKPTDEVTPPDAAEESEESEAGEEDTAIEPGDADVLEKDPLTYATEQFILATAERPGQLDWALVEAAVARADGMPVVVGSSIKNAATSAASH